jgi:hypothetical protein
MFTPNLVLGVGIMAAGIVLMLDRLRMVDALALLRYWPVGLILFGASIVAQALRRNGGTVAGGPAQRPVIGPGFVLFLAIAAFVGSNFVERRIQPRSVRGDGLRVTGVMSKDSRASSGTRFRGADMTSVMGSSELDLRDAMLAPGEEATVDVFAMMGESVVIVPDGWAVDIRTTPVMGKVVDQRLNRNARPRAPDVEDAATAEGGARAREDTPEAPPRLIIRGMVMMGALRIRS